MLMIKKAYFEITNVCNLSCSFCPKTKRPKRFVSVEEFEAVARKLQGKIEYLYLHLMGEPTLHPQLEEILSISENLGFKVIITTNGTLIKAQQELLLTSASHYKTVISLHSFEANRNQNFNDYLMSMSISSLDLKSPEILSKSSGNVPIALFSDDSSL